MTLSVDKAVYKQHEPVQLTVTLTNQTDQEVKFWQPGDRVLSLIMKYPDGSTALEEFENAGAFFTTDPVRIGPGQSYRCTRAIEPYYLGTHTISGRCRLRLTPDIFRGRLRAEAISFVIEESADAEELLKAKFDRLMERCKSEFKAGGTFGWPRLARLGLGAEEYLIDEIGKAEDAEFKRRLESALRRMRESP